MGPPPRRHRDLQVMGGSNLALLDLQQNRIGLPGATALARAVRALSLRFPPRLFHRFSAMNSQHLIK